MFHTETHCTRAHVNAHAHTCTTLQHTAHAHMRHTARHCTHTATHCTHTHVSHCNTCNTLQHMYHTAIQHTAHAHMYHTAIHCIHTAHTYTYHTVPRCTHTCAPHCNILHTNEYQTTPDQQIPHEIDTNTRVHHLTTQTYTHFATAPLSVAPARRARNLSSIEFVNHWNTHRDT